MAEIAKNVHALVGRLPATPLPCRCALTIECRSTPEAKEMFCAAMDARESPGLFPGQPNVREALPGEVVSISTLRMVKARGPSLACESLVLDGDDGTFHITSLCADCRALLAQEALAHA